MASARRKRSGMALTREQIVDIAKKTGANVSALLAEASILLEAQHPARAHALAVLALEEFGKHAISVSALLRTNEPGFWPKYWQRVGDHREKLRQARFAVQLFGEWDEFDQPDALERIGRWVESRHADRMAGLYVDVLPDGMVVSPEEAITVEEASGIIVDLQLLVPIADFTARMLAGAEVEGWERWDELMASGNRWTLEQSRDIARGLRVEATEHQ